MLGSNELWGQMVWLKRIAQWILQPADTPTGKQDSANVTKRRRSKSWIHTMRMAVISSIRMNLLSLIRFPGKIWGISFRANLESSANNYQNGENEMWIGEWMEKRGIRDEIVLATKYTSPWRRHNENELQANYVGNNAKSLRVSVEASLKKLKTDYIDLVSSPTSDASVLQVSLLIDIPALRPLVGL